MTFWPIFVGAATVGVTLIFYLRLKYSGSKMRLGMSSMRNLRGKVAVITGASSGLGREVAYHLVKCQAEVVLACRDRVKTQKAVEFIENRLKIDRSPAPSSSNTTASSDQPFGKLHVMDLDLADFRSIDRFTTEFQNRFQNLHILINNAGVMACPYSTSRGGKIESHFAINHLGHFYLTNRLLPILKRSSPSRILIITSGYYRKMGQGGMEKVSVEAIFGGVDSDQGPVERGREVREEEVKGQGGVDGGEKVKGQGALGGHPVKSEAAVSGQQVKVQPVNVHEVKGQSEMTIGQSDYDPLKAYARSKLANCLHGYELARRLQDDQVRVFVIRPGFVRGTELGRYFSGLLTTLAKPFIWMFSQTVEQGVQTYLYCAMVEDDQKLKTGRLYYNCAEQPYLDNLVNETNAREFWNLSERLVEVEKKALEKMEDGK